ncbi:Repeat domain-containing protein [Sporobacter termitidis DSM 10068]|uniref:Repeat domain-containing protein n=1 Tax=Sporobacter termitidis DSM 10068 TaxID=1123282 RepID=A0A1M5YXH9_9FIRM|nr:VCBS repeat-containing protein [Sporobacter termitidis]SHI16283.1 Repeat domain-containing protein [Sporobacter termitidis DSM 10068]
MHRFGRYAAAVLCLLFAVVALSGCFSITANELYSLPQPSKEFLKLQEQINTVLSTGAEYSPPTAGPNRQSVQLKDLNSDGQNEAIAFFRTTGDKPLKIYILQQSGATYKTADVIEGDGTGIESIRYADLDGDGTMELIVGWQMGASLTHMNIYSIKGGQHVSLADDDYTQLSVSDMDNDGNPDVMAVRLPSSEQPGQADMYSLRADGEVDAKTAQLSKGIESISYVIKGRLLDESPALFIESSGSGKTVVTDILTWVNGGLYNITADTSGGVSKDTLRSYAAYSTDINNDKVTEVPFPRLLGSSADTKYYVIDWYAYNKYGYRSKVFTTYHDFSDGWYLILPDDWKSADDWKNISVRRDDSVAGERTLIFSYISAPGETPIEFLKIYTLSGDNRFDRAAMAGRFRLEEHGDGDMVYAAEILASVTGITADKTQIINGFRLLYSDWATGIIS